jgi:Flp pilus assembly protein TadG
VRWTRSAATEAGGARRARGAAVVDFVLVAVVLVPLALGVLQLGLVLYVRNVAAAAASEGARVGAQQGHTWRDGEARTRTELAGTLSARYAGGVSAGPAVLDGAPAVEVRVRVRVPALGLGGPAVSLTVTGHAVRELP